MFLAKIGSDGQVHRIMTAYFEKGRSNGTAYCEVEGAVQYTEAQVVTCQKCRDYMINLEAKNRLQVKRKEA